jgi:hypothetical protein
MAHQLSFEQLSTYEPGEPGIAIDIELKLGDVIVPCQAHIDTGASYCVFARSIGEHLGLDIETGVVQFIGTAIGAFKTFGHGVTLLALGYEFDVIAYFAEAPGVNRKVLGRHGWLDRVQLGLIDYEGKLYLSRYGDE